MEEIEWHQSSMENDTLARHVEREHSRTRFKSFIALCEARIANREATKKDMARAVRENDTIEISKFGTGLSTKLSVVLSKLMVLMAKEWKTFAYLDRGEPFKGVFAVNGFSSEPSGM